MKSSSSFRWIYYIDIKICSLVQVLITSLITDQLWEFVTKDETKNQLWEFVTVNTFFFLLCAFTFLFSIYDFVKWTAFESHMLVYFFLRKFNVEELWRGLILGMISNTWKNFKSKLSGKILAVSKGPNMTWHIALLKPDEVKQNEWEVFAKDRLSNEFKVNILAFLLLLLLSSNLIKFSGFHQYGSL